MSYADLHFHLLPGVDDGPTDLAESVDLARAAVADGTRIVVATPHVRRDFVTDPLDLVDRVRELRAALAEARVPLDVRRGGELGHDLVGLLRQAELEAIAQGPTGNRWLLVETPFEGFTADFHAATAELRGRGFGVVLAHPERTAFAATDGVQGLRRELASGSLAQVNAMSLTGRHGEEALEAGHALVSLGLADVVASDAHGLARPPSLGAAWAALIDAGVEPGTAWSVVRERPALLVADGIPVRAVRAVLAA
ncbi:MAG TPA: CpsB/CapC family capsule biosynthesis tyrosine phosphatase [Thermoleophilaceae bacterium]|nr:CpsB/CapC family capsule biosynthesis tyrosine phosphatase [Thermoleophilaceae bacterium]